MADAKWILVRNLVFSWLWFWEVGVEGRYGGVSYLPTWFWRKKKAQAVADWLNARSSTVAAGVREGGNG